MLGFATLDLSAGGNALTVWLASVQGAGAGHTNAVPFKLGDDTAPRSALGTICDRYVVLFDWTPHERSLFIDWGAEPADMAMLAEETIAAQAATMFAFGEHRPKPGKTGLIDAVQPPVLSPFGQAVLQVGTPVRVTLAVANQVIRAWTAWLATAGERITRWTYMPGDCGSETRAVLPAELMKRNPIQPIRPLPL